MFWCQRFNFNHITMLELSENRASNSTMTQSKVGGVLTLAHFCLNAAAVEIFVR
jgi:hypothetical protein